MSKWIQKLSVMLFLVGCAQAPVQTLDDSADWKVKMQGLSKSVSTLLPLTLNSRKFNDPKNREIIQSETQNLAKLAHGVDTAKMPPDMDPAIRFTSRRFTDDLIEANRQLNGGDRKYAQHLIKNALNYCVTCHTRIDKGSQIKLTLNSNLNGFNAFERAHYYMAIRNYDLSLQEYSKGIKSADAALETHQQIQRASQQALALAIRVKKDPVIALQIVDDILNSKWAPIYLKLNAMYWKKSIQSWSREQKKTYANRADKLKHAKELIDKADKAANLSAGWQAGLVENLRASALLHEILSAGAQDLTSKQALYYAGLTSEALKDITYDSMYESYYESCIRQMPYTELAKKCYIRLEGSILTSYSYDDAVLVPISVRERLAELRALAEQSEGLFIKWDF